MDNMLKLVCNNIIRESIVEWSRSGGKSFVVCFENVAKKRKINFKQCGGSKREVLGQMINYLNSTTFAQIICYAYEIVLMDEKVIARMKESSDFRKDIGIYATEDISNDYEFFNFIRNAISHNDDLGDNLYVYSPTELNYKFRLNKKGKENSEIIINIP